MSDIELVIKIPKETYDFLKKYGTDGGIIEKAVLNGTPLPKGHKIIDEYALQEHLALVPMEDRTYREAVEIIDWFPSIIEADKGEGSDKE